MIQHKVGPALLPHQHRVAAEVKWRVLVQGHLLVAIHTLFCKACELVRCNGLELASFPLEAFRIRAAGEALYQHPHLWVVELSFAFFAVAGGVATTRSSRHG